MEEKLRRELREFKARKLEESEEKLKKLILKGLYPNEQSIILFALEDFKQKCFNYLEREYKDRLINNLKKSEGEKWE